MSGAIAINTWMLESGMSLGRRSSRLRTLDKMIRQHYCGDGTYANMPAVKSAYIQWLDKNYTEALERNKKSGVVARLETYLDLVRIPLAMVNQDLLIRGRENIVAMISLLEVQPKYLVNAVSFAEQALGFDLNVAGIKHEGMDGAGAVAKFGAKKLDQRQPAAPDAAKELESFLQRILHDAWEAIESQARQASAGIKGLVNKVVDVAPIIIAIVAAVMKAIGSELVPLVGQVAGLAKGLKDAAYLIVSTLRSSALKSRSSFKPGTPQFMIDAIEEASYANLGKSVLGIAAGITAIVVQVMTLSLAWFGIALGKIVATAVSMLHDAWTAERMRAVVLEAKQHYQNRVALCQDGLRYNSWFRAVIIEYPTLAACVLVSGFCPNDRFFLDINMEGEQDLNVAQAEAGLKFMNELKNKSQMLLDRSNIKLVSNDKLIHEVLQARTFSH